MTLRRSHACRSQDSLTSSPSRTIWLTGHGDVLRALEGGPGVLDGVEAEQVRAREVVAALGHAPHEADDVRVAHEAEHAEQELLAQAIEGATRGEAPEELVQPPDEGLEDGDGHALRGPERGLDVARLEDAQALELDQGVAVIPARVVVGRRGRLLEELGGQVGEAEVEVIQVLAGVGLLGVRRRQDGDVGLIQQALEAAGDDVDAEEVALVQTALGVGQAPDLLSALDALVEAVVRRQVERRLQAGDAVLLRLQSRLVRVAAAAQDLQVRERVGPPDLERLLVVDDARDVEAVVAHGAAVALALLELVALVLAGVGARVRDEDVAHLQAELRRRLAGVDHARLGGLREGVEEGGVHGHDLDHDALDLEAGDLARALGQPLAVGEALELRFDGLVVEVVEHVLGLGLLEGLEAEGPHLVEGHDVLVPREELDGPAGLVVLGAHGALRAVAVALAVEEHVIAVDVVLQRRAVGEEAVVGHRVVVPDDAAHALSEAQGHDHPRGDAALAPALSEEGVGLRVAVAVHLLGELVEGRLEVGASEERHEGAVPSHLEQEQLPQDAVLVVDEGAGVEVLEVEQRRGHDDGALKRTIGVELLLCAAAREALDLREHLDRLRVVVDPDIAAGGVDGQLVLAVVQRAGADELEDLVAHRSVLVVLRARRVEAREADGLVEAVVVGHDVHAALGRGHVARAVGVVEDGRDDGRVGLLVASVEVLAALGDLDVPAPVLAHLLAHPDPAQAPVEGHGPEGVLASALGAVPDLQGRLARVVPAVGVEPTVRGHEVEARPTRDEMDAISEARAPPRSNGGVDRGAGRRSDAWSTSTGHWGKAF
jgi:hypothetical protein